MNTATKTEQTEALIQLKAEADKLGINYHPNIGFNKLQERIEVAIAAKAQRQDEETPEPNIERTHTPAHVKDRVTGRLMTPAEVRQMKRKRATELVRVRVSCMNPNKKDWEGEIFSIGNSQIPTQKKYVPFDVEEGWHIPRIMVDWLKNKKYQSFVKERDYRGREIKRAVQKSEFSVEILPPLTPEEFKALKQRQVIASGKVD